MTPRVSPHLLVTVSFFLSGAAGLTYEIVWARYLSMFLGSDGYAVTIVLSTFMGGLAIGNFAAGYFADRIQKLLLWFGMLEVLVGLCAIAFPFWFRMASDLYVQYATGREPDFPSLAVKLFVSVLLILFPSILMGGTLPILARFATHSMAQLSHRVAMLYAANSAGAVLGCWIADFWWIPTSGLEATLLRASYLNLGIGGGAILLQFVARSAQTQPSRPGPHSHERPRLSSPTARWGIVAVGVSGFVIMLYEVAWTRVLALSLGASTHAFSLMLMAFIAGITLGAIILFSFKSLRRDLTTLAWLQMVTGLSLLLSLSFLDRLGLWLVNLAGFLSRTDDSYAVYAMLQGLICVGITLIPMTCAGMSLPVASQVVGEETRRVGGSVGIVFAVNTLGTVLGVMVTGWWLMPQFGLAATFALGIGLNLSLAVVLLLKDRISRKRWLLGASAMIMSAVLMLGWTIDAHWQNRFATGIWRYENKSQALRFFHSARQSNEIEYYRDGTTATVSVSKFDYQGQPHRVLKVNGKPDASTIEDMSTQLLLGHVPMLLRPDSERALVVGLGSGITAAAVARHPAIRHVDVVEISPEVVAAARYFDEISDGVLDDPRVHTIVDDAKTYLQSTAHRYDVIISEPSNPWMKGVASLFSLEFYGLCRQRLRPNGLMVQWFHTYEASDEMLDTVLATFGEHFAHISIWQSSATDLLLVGSVEPVTVDFSATLASLQASSVAADLRHIGVEGLVSFLSCQVVPQENGRYIPPTETPSHSDYRPRLEFMAQRAFFSKGKAERWQIFDEKQFPRSNLLLAHYLRANPPAAADLRTVVDFSMRHAYPRPRIIRSIASRWHELERGSLLPYELSASLSETFPEVQTGVAMEREALRLGSVSNQLLRLSSTSPSRLQNYARILLAAYREERSLFYLPSSHHLREVLNRLTEIDTKHRRLYQLQLAELAWDRGDDQRLIELGTQAIEPDGTGSTRLSFAQDRNVTRNVIAHMITSHWRNNRREEAWFLCKNAKAAGFIERPSRYQNHYLDMVYQKVQAAHQKP